MTKGHSTETVHLKLISDIYDIVDIEHVMLGSMQDVSIVDPDILLSRLRASYGVVRQWLEWTMTVAFGMNNSHSTPVTLAVLWGSVLGQHLNVLQMADLITSTSAIGAQVNQYVGQVQLRLICHPSNSGLCIQNADNRNDSADLTVLKSTKAKP